MLDWLTPELDLDIRAYALYLSPDDGEDGYHTVIERCLRLQTPCPIRPQAFLRTATKHEVYKIWRHRTSEATQAESYSRGEAPVCVVALQKGRLPHTHCRRGHEFTAGNVIYVGTARTCKTCEHLRRAKYKERT